jgi:sulfide dehydrogenase [flavocytochrome c] flavoprotein chain
MKNRCTDRRRFLQSAAAVAASAGPRSRKSSAHTSRPSGGFRGASGARELKRLDPRLQVTLIEPNAIYKALPLSNAVIEGLRDLKQQQFGYDALQRAGIAVVHAAVTGIDMHAQSLTLGNSAKLSYEWLVISPGIDFRWSAIQGYDDEASKIIPHAWTDAGQIDLLRRQLERMRDGGTVAIAVPRSIRHAVRRHATKCLARPRPRIRKLRLAPLQSSSC